MTIEPGTWRTRDGGIAVVERSRASFGTAIEWVGNVPGFLTVTWWYEDGRHNTYRNHDLIEKLEGLS